MTHDSSFGSLDSGCTVAPVRYPNLFRAPFHISMSCDHNPKLVSFRIMFTVNAKLYGGTTICGDEFEVNGLVGFISIFVGFCLLAVVLCRLTNR